VTRIVKYGRLHAQRAELWRPAGDPATPRPVVVLLHGGFWRGRYTKVLMRKLARAATTRGWIAWNVEYRRVGRFGRGGGWPATFADVAAAVDHLAGVDGVDLDRVVTLGHSAGGHLALWAAGRHRLPDTAPGAAPRVRLAGAVSLAGVHDLAVASRTERGRVVVVELLGGPPDELPDRYALASPSALLPLGVPQLLVHGTADTTVALAQSADHARRAAALGDDVTYAPLDGVDHMSVIDPANPAWQIAADWIGARVRTG
jgi:acetyl esterase/lipase